MSKEYWERVCKNYDSEVLSVWDRDREGLVRAWLESTDGCQEQTAADVGCGVGKFVPLLAELFSTVEACDITETGLRSAKQRCDSKGIGNVNFHQLDLCCDRVSFEPVDLVLCVNVLLMGSFDERMRSWRTVTNQVVSGGRLIVVVPALESILLQQHMDRNEMLEGGVDCKTSLDRSLPKGSTVLDLHQGVHLLEGFPTKHYLKSELEHLIHTHHFAIETLEPITYEVGGEESPSWDWFVVAKRNHVL